MQKRLIAVLCLLAGLSGPCFAQSQPNIVDLPNGAAGTNGRAMKAQDLKGFLGGKVDVNNGELATPTITAPAVTGGNFATPSITAPAIAGGTMASPAINTPAVTGGTMASPAIATPSVTGGVLTGTVTDQATITARSAVNPRTNANRAADFLNPLDFLTGGITEAQITGGSSDATPFFNAALAAGGTVYVPCGTYLFLSNLVLPANTMNAIVGRSQGCVTFNISYSTINNAVVPFISVAGTNSNFMLRDVTLNGLSGHASGITMQLAGFQTAVEHVSFTGVRLEAIGMGAANTTRIRDVDFRPGTSNSCIFMNGPTETFIDKVTMASCGIGINVSAAAGTYLTDVDIIQSNTNGILLDPDATQYQNISVFVGRNVEVDTTINGDGMMIEGTGPVVDVRMTQMWASATGQISSTVWNPHNGLNIENPLASALQFNGLFGESNGLALFDIEFGSHIQITSPMGCNESQSGVGTSAAMIVGAGANYVTITDPTGGQCGFTGQTVGLPNKASYGLLINSVGTTNHYTLIGKSGFDTTFQTGQIYYDPADPNMIVVADNTNLMQTVRNVTSGTTDAVQTSDYWINLNTGASVTETLPVCSITSTIGHQIVIRDASGTAGTYNDTIQAPAGGTTVNGGISITINTAHGGKILTCNGLSDWGAVSTN